MPLAQAAKESGLAHNTLRLLINQGKLKAVKKGTDWFVEYADVLNYMEHRQPRGRPAKRRKARRPKAGKVVDMVDSLKTSVERLRSAKPKTPRRARAS